MAAFSRHTDRHRRGPLVDSGGIFGGVTGFGGRHDDDADVVAADRRGPGGLEIAAARVMFPVFSRR